MVPDQFANSRDKLVGIYGFAKMHLITGSHCTNAIFRAGESGDCNGRRFSSLGVSQISHFLHESVSIRARHADVAYYNFRFFALQDLQSFGRAGSNSNNRPVLCKYFSHELKRVLFIIDNQDSGAWEFEIRMSRRLEGIAYLVHLRAHRAKRQTYRKRCALPLAIARRPNRASVERHKLLDYCEA